LAGFHHDYLGQLEKAGAIIVTNKRMGPHGFYMADISIAGRTYRNKTFFPQEWPQEKVIHKIYEVYD
jgi:hypothetical protein